jgi:hypothetical protein
MPLDKVLSSSIANGAVTAALISNTANLVVSSLTANVITITTISGSANVTGDMTVGGNLTISGTTTYVNTTDLNIGDAIISLNADLAANVSPTENAGLNINRGASTNAQFVWVESTDNWSLGNTTVSGILNANDTIITGTANVSTGINVGANVNLSTTYMDVGNSTVNTTITNITVSTNTVNVASIINVGANVNLSTSQINVGNSTVNTVITSTSLTTTSNTVSLGTAAYFVANGNVGVGTASPGSKLDILRSSTTTTAFDESLIRAINTGAATLNQRVDIGMRFQDGTYNGIGGISMIRESATARSGGLSFSSIGSDGNPTNAMRIDSSGNLGLGNTINSYGSQTTFTLSGSNVSRIDFRSNSTFTGTVLSYQAVTEGLRLQTEAGYPITFYPAGTESMRINSTGSISLNGPSGTHIIRRNAVSGSSGIKIQANANDAVSDTNPGAAILLSGGLLTDTYEGNIDLIAYGAVADVNRNQIRFSNRSGVNTVSERMRIDHNGQVGIGTTIPNAKLSIIDEDGGQAMIQMRNFSTSATGAFLGTYATELRSASTGATVHGARIHLNEANNDRRTLDVADYNGIFASFVNGKVGIGTVTPSSKLHVAGTILFESAAGNGFVFNGCLGDSFGGGAAGTIFAADPVSGGNFQYWRCTADYNGTPQIMAYIYANGGLYNYSNNNSNLSDMRVKKDIELAGSYLDKICAIPVKTFRYKNQTLQEDQELSLGVIAQDVEAVAPELVNLNGFGETPEDGVPLKAIYQTDLQFALMKCIQEQQALITQLTARITALETA